MPVQNYSKKREIQMNIVLTKSLMETSSTLTPVMFHSSLSSPELDDIVPNLLA